MGERELGGWVCERVASRRRNAYTSSHGSRWVGESVRCGCECELRECVYECEYERECMGGYACVRECVGAYMPVKG